MGDFNPGIQAVIDAFPDVALDGAFREVYEDVGCAGLCVDVSKEFIDLLRKDGWNRRTAMYFWIKPYDDGFVPADYRVEAGGDEDHCVVVFADGGTDEVTVVDWSAGQYNPALPAPYVWKLSRLELQKVEHRVLPGG